LLTFDATPEVHLGKDITVPLTPTYKIENAISLNYEQLHWTSLGDGNFDDPFRIDPTYIFGEDDLLQGIVQLILTASSSCGIIADTVTLILRNLYSVEGRVLAEGNPVPGLRCLLLLLLPVR